MNGLLEGRTVFLSASFPSGERGLRFRASDPAEIADAVTALARAVFTANGKLVFGGHPTITPLVLFVASEHQQRGGVTVYQSRWFERDTPEETRRLEELGFGRIHWTERAESLSESLLAMRTQMLRESDPAAGVFVGGMEGIFDEWDLFGEMLSGRPRIPIGAPGGAASDLVERASDLVSAIPIDLNSRRYPTLAHQLVTFLGGR